MRRREERGGRREESLRSCRQLKSKLALT